MGKAPGRTHLATEELKRLASELHRGGLTDKAILEQLNELEMVGEKPVTRATLKRWRTLMPDIGKDELIHSTYMDVMYLRQRAFRATALTEVNRAYITERAYWWGLYISSLHIMLRQALAIDAAAELPPQFIMDNLEQWYADIRAIQQMTPPLDLGDKGGETAEQVKSRMDEFERKYARNVIKPKETL